MTIEINQQQPEQDPPTESTEVNTTETKETTEVTEKPADSDDDGA